MLMPNTHGGKRSASDKARHAARIKDWRLRNEIRERVWNFLCKHRGEKEGARAREALERSLSKLEARL